MKKWKEYSKSERAMLIAIGILVLLILLTSDRVKEGARQGFRHFFSTSSVSIGDK